jgi:shikimate kinase
MITFLIGPSRAGKSTLSRAISAQFPEIAFIDLDLRVNEMETQLATPPNDGWPGRWNRSIAIFDEAEQNHKDVVMDVGAGSLQTPEAFEYFGRCLSNLILISAPFDAILARHPNRKPEELLGTEFSQLHNALHARIARRIDTSELSQEEAAGVLSSFLREAYLGKLG